MDAEDAARRRGKLHGQMRGGDYDAKGVERGAAEEDILGCRRINDEETDRDTLGLGAVAEDGMEVNIAASETFPLEKP